MSDSRLGCRVMRTNKSWNHGPCPLHRRSIITSAVCLLHALVMMQQPASWERLVKLKEGSLLRGRDCAAENSRYTGRSYPRSQVRGRSLDNSCVETEVAKSCWSPGIRTGGDRRFGESGGGLAVISMGKWATLSCWAVERETGMNLGTEL